MLEKFWQPLEAAHFGQCSSPVSRIFLPGDPAAHTARSDVDALMYRLDNGLGVKCSKEQCVGAENEEQSALRLGNALAGC